MALPDQLPLAATLLAACDAGESLSRLPPAATPGPAGTPLDPAAIAAAYDLQDAISAMRQARGERPAGFKIGFTNRSIWPLYGVYQPIWAPVWDSTVRLLDTPSATVSQARLAEPRLEPEIVIGLSDSPPADADARDAAATRRLLECVAWVAHGVEIVHSIWPGWRFDAAQAIAAQSLHGALLVGPRVTRTALGHDPAGALAGLRLTLSRDGVPVAEGTGANALDGPIRALGHLVAGLAARGERIDAGAVVTTGTLVDAQPLAPGQVWRTSIAGVPLPGLTLTVTA
jgi:2-oxo-3-hexenedioate decarboxylase